LGFGEVNLKVCNGSTLLFWNRPMGAIVEQMTLLLMFAGLLIATFATGDAKNVFE